MRPLTLKHRYAIWMALAGATFERWNDPEDVPDDDWREAMLRIAMELQRRFGATVEEMDAVTVTDEEFMYAMLTAGMAILDAPYPPGLQ